MITTKETTRYQGETRALPLNTALARELQLLLTAAIDASGDREARIYKSMLRRLDAAKDSAIHGIFNMSWSYPTRTRRHTPIFPSSTPTPARA